jgi:organic radical activating enzyme
LERPEIVTKLNDNYYPTSSVFLDSLVIEITRRCNYNCEHCIRGEPENLDLTLDKFIEVFNKSYPNVSIIDEIGFSGGEPLLNTSNLINIFYYLVRDKNIRINSFFIITNGSKFSIEFFEFMTEIFSGVLFSKREFALRISNSPFHIKERGFKIEAENLFLFVKNYNFLIKDYNKNIERYKQIEKSLKLIKIGEDYESNYDLLINKGRASNLPKDGYHEVDNSSQTFPMPIDYMTVNGDIFNNCDFSYEEFDNFKI